MAYSTLTAHRAGNPLVSWRYRFYYDTEAAYTTFAEFDNTTGTGEQWWGMVTNRPRIRRSIDLVKCQAKVSNLTIELANADFRGAPLWDELSPFDGTRKYLNRKVEVLQMVNGSTSNTPLYTGRVREIQLDRASGKISVTVEPNQPWDFISIPSAFDSQGFAEPVIYGLYSKNTGGLDVYASGVALWPAKVVAKANNVFRCLLHEEASSDCRLHSYEESVEQLMPVYGAGGFIDTPETINGMVYVETPPEFKLINKTKAVYRRDATYDAFTDPINAFDVVGANDSTTSADVTVDIIYSGFGGYYGAGGIGFDIPALSVPVTGTIDIEVRVSASLTGTETATVGVYNSVGVLASEAIVNGDNTKTLTINKSDATTLYVFVIAYDSFSGGSASFSLYDVRVKQACQIDLTSDEQAVSTFVKGLKELYCGADGLAKSWSSGACSTLQEFHRDILIRYCGLSTGTPTGYSEVDSARSGWNGRLWLHEPTEVREVLEQLQYEGQFIFDWSPTGTAKYIAVKSSYSSGDVEATLNENDHTTGLQVSHTPFTELVTKQEITYERHPADDSRYLSSYTHTNSTARTAWNIQTLENVETVELDYLVAAADEFAEARDAVLGDIHPMIETTIVTPLYWVLTVGDIIQFADDSNYYMITEERRGQDGLGITARRVG